MAKKDYLQGLAGLLTPTVEVKEMTVVKEAAVKVETEETESLYVNLIPSSLKRRMDVYCAEHKMKKHEFIAAAIRKYLDMVIL